MLRPQSMMLGLPWWLWLAAAIAAFFVFGFRRAKAWRASIRAEFIAYLRREAPELEVVAERDQELDIRRADGGTGTLSLGRLYREGTYIPVGDTAGKEAFFARFVAMLREGDKIASLDPEADRARVFPRLVPDAFFTGVPARAAGRAPATLPSGVPGLSIALVLDSETSVAYLTDELLADLKLSPDEALSLAKENLRRSMDVGAAVRRTVTEKSMNVLKGGDSYDAARILLVPESLAEGEEIAAAIPDRDTLMLTLPPLDGDWSRLRKLARTPAGDVLWREPLLVRSTGISAVPPASGR
jgi:hypothetical protein